MAGPPVVTNSAGQPVEAMATYQVDTAGQVAGQQAYQLASNAAPGNGGSTAPVEGVAAGSYLLAITATWNGATIKLQTLGPDAATWLDVPSASLTANGAIGVAVGANATLRLTATGGAPTGVYGNLS